MLILFMGGIGIIAVYFLLGFEKKDIRDSSGKDID
jgi:hypothetical protein